MRVAAGETSTLTKEKTRATLAIRELSGPWGDAIRHLRLAKGWTRHRLAREAGIKPTTYGKVERGLHTQTRILAAIAAALDVPLQDVLMPPREPLLESDRRDLVLRITDEVLAALRPQLLQLRK